MSALVLHSCEGPLAPDDVAPRLTVPDVLAAVCDVWAVAPAAVLARRVRTGGVGRAREAACLLAADLLGRSTTQIGRAMGGRDHTTIGHALAQARARTLDPHQDAWRERLHLSAMRLGRAWPPASPPLASEGRAA
jgi:hypothetical protein